ncbi:MAG: SusC/RagA family TonB-linked outer membrane protein [Prevotella sp.]|jgi:TonB-linked SusC/RagA family outer membrane protein
MNRFLTTMLLLFCVIGMKAQSNDNLVYGTITDSKTGESLIGVVIKVEGSQNAAITDMEGGYSLKAEQGSTLQISYVGYKSKTVKVPSAGRFNIELESDNTELNEVVVVGYGKMRKSDLTGSLSSISSDELKNIPEANLSNMLAGRASGVYVAASSGQPGSDAVIRVRGFGTVNDNNPLYVVDGQFMDNISSINPSDIDHIEILKDASSCAVYGSRGSNGVILITTKNGVKGKTNISFDASIGARMNGKSLDMMNSEEFYNFITTAYKDDESFQTNSLEKFTNQYNKGYDTDWWDEVTHTGFNQNYNLSISKGTDNSKSYLSLGYVDEQGTIITTYYNRINLNLKQEYDLNRFVTVGANFTLSDARKRDTSHLASFDFILKADPFTPVISPLVDPNSENYEYNKYAPTEWSFDPNPVSLLKLPYNRTDISHIFGNAYAVVHIVKGLSYRFQISYSHLKSRYKSFTPIYTATFSEDNLANRESKYNTETKMTNNDDVTKNYIIENRLNYNTQIGKHNIDAMFGITYEKNDEAPINAYKSGALGNDEAYRVLDAQTTGDLVSGSRYKTSMLSYIGRLNYSFDDRYLLTASFRADGSSRFSKDNRWGFFPSVAGAWRISNEKFFINSSLSKVISNAKLRVGWGINGNQRIDRRAALTLIGTDNEKQWWFGNDFSQGYVPTYTGNSDVKWEKDQQTNIGLDLGFFNNELNVTMDFYIKKTKDMLLSVPIPDFGSYSNDPYFNAGDLKNTGFDMSIDYHHNFSKDFAINAGLNFSTYKTKVTSLTSEYLSGNVSRTYVGGPIGRFYGWEVIGIFQTQEEIDNYKAEDGSVIQPNAQPGDFKFKKITSSGALNDDDRTFIGDPNPDLIYGFNVGFEFKGFDFSMFFQGTLGNDLYNVSKGTLASVGYQNALADAYNKAWKQSGDNAEYPRITNSDTNNNYRTSSFYVEDGSYLRLQNLQLGYSLPASLCKKIKLISSCRFYFSAQNLFTITGYSGLDPEVGVDNPLNMGYDTLHYPSSRTITFGVNLQF